MDDTQACRFCFDYEGPLGLQDVLITPCGCSGTAAHSHVSCLYRWQLTKAQSLFRDPERCEVCQQPYRIPLAALRALVAEGSLPPAPRAPQLLRIVARLMAAAHRALRPLLLLAEAMTMLVSAADYALQAHALVPAILADPRVLRPYRHEWGLGMATLSFLLPVVTALRVGEDDDHPLPAAQLRRLRQGVGVARVAFHASLLAAAALADYRWNATTASNASLAPSVRRGALLAQDFDRLVLEVALPLAAAGVGASSAWWRFWVLAWWRPKAEAAALAGAAGRVLAWLRWAAQHTGLLPHLQGAAAALQGSAVAARAVEWAAAAGSWVGAAGGKRRGRGPLEELLWGIRGRGGLDAAGAFSA